MSTVTQEVPVVAKVYFPIPSEGKDAGLFDWGLLGRSVFLMGGLFCFWFFVGPRVFGLWISIGVLGFPVLFTAHTPVIQLFSFAATLSDHSWTAAVSGFRAPQSEEFGKLRTPGAGERLSSTLYAVSAARVRAHRAISAAESYWVFPSTAAAFRRKSHKGTTRSEGS